MKFVKSNFSRSVISIAVQGLLTALAVTPLLAQADGDADIAQLVNPTNTIAVGANNVSAQSAKFGEYNGLAKTGTTSTTSLDMRGGDSYGKGSGTDRWSLMGSDIGTTSQSLGIGYSSQGDWGLGIKFDDLRHYGTDTYQTPYLGAVGGNNFTLPASFGVIDSKDKPTVNANPMVPYGAQALTQSQLQSFQGEDIYSDRKNVGISANKALDSRWKVQFDFNRLNQDGAKLISAGTDSIVGASTFPKVIGQAIVMLPNPTDYQTDTISLNLSYAGDKSHYSIGYYASLFSDANTSLQFSNPYISANPASATYTGTNPGAAFPVDALSTAPSNQFHQLNMAGGLELTPTTKLAGNFSYGLNLQNENFVNQNLMQTGGLPQQSLNGAVNTTHADVKVTNQYSKDLALTAGWNFNERENRTDANVYKFYDIGAGAETSVSIPMSNSKSQYQLGADYRVDQRQKVNVSYEFEQVKRWCDSSLSNSAQGVGPGTTAGAAALYYTGTPTCAEVPLSDDNKLQANYKLRTDNGYDLLVGYAYSNRQAEVNPSFYNPMQAKDEGYEMPGYRAYFDASRVEQAVRTRVNWQTNDKLSIAVSGKLTTDQYTDSAYGVQSGNTWSVNGEATYAFNENNSLTTFADVQSRSRDLLSQGWSHTTATYFTSAGTLWDNTLSTKDVTFGLSAKNAGLMSGRLTLKSDLLYTLGTTGYSTTDYYTNVACTATSTSGYQCGATPTISNETVQVKFTGTYALDKASRIVAGYAYQKLVSNDYLYDAYQAGYTATNMLPTNQLSGSYEISLISLMLVHNF